MPPPSDPRVPVRLRPLAAPPGPPSAATLVLLEEGAPSGEAPPPERAALRVAFAPAHEATGRFCACCAGRAPFATALGRLYADRARGAVPFFEGLEARGTARGLAHARAALAVDPFLLARYRLVDDGRA